MKYLDITLGYQPGQGIIYPGNYQVEIGDFAVDHLYYKDGKIDKLLLVIPDDNYDLGMVRTNVVEVNEAAAKQISEDKEPRLELITDEAKVRRLAIKASLGIALTVEEEAALDPDDPTPGFGREKILSDRIDDLKVVYPEKL